MSINIQMFNNDGFTCDEPTTIHPDDDLRLISPDGSTVELRGLITFVGSDGKVLHLVSTRKMHEKCPGAEVSGA